MMNSNNNIDNMDPVNDPEITLDEEPPSYNEIYNSPGLSRYDTVIHQENQVEEYPEAEGEEKSEEHNPKQKTWREVFYDFTQNTSLHGARQITEPQPYLVRRILWLLVFLGSSTLLLIQLALSVQYYISWPVSVDVKINYNDSILFPTVTICNENTFRTTVAYERGLYSLLSELFVGPHPNVNLDKYNASQVSLESLHRDTGHTGQDLIVRCEWEGESCSVADFVPQITDFGLCYTFNGGTQLSQIRMASTTGSGGGLRLQLNIEQYEYMRGPNEGAGLKILIHNYNEIPRVKDHGVAVPPGSHAFMAVKTTEVSNLEPQHGKCNDSVKLEYFDDYTVENCYTNCKEKVVLQNCGCRDVYMPGNTNVCTLSQYQGCLLNALESFSQHKDQCVCPIPCHRLLYEPVVSYASTSNFDISGLLRSKSTDKLREKFLKAREIKQKVTKSTVKEDIDMITAFNTNFHDFSDASEHISEILHSVRIEVKDKFRVMEQHAKFHLSAGLENVNALMESDFIREWETFKERTFNQLMFDFMGLSALLKGAIKDANGTISFDDKDKRNLVYLPVATKLYRRLTLIEMSARHLEEVFEEKYKNREFTEYPIHISYMRRYDTELISEKLLDSRFEAVGKEVYNKFFIHADELETKMDTGIRHLLNAGRGFADNNFFNETLYEMGKDLWITSCASFNTLIFEYEKHIISAPRQLIQDAIGDFKFAEKTMSDAHAAVVRKLDFIGQSFNVSMETQWDLGAKIAGLSSLYLSQRNINKVEIAELVTSPKVDESFYALHLFFSDIKLWLSDLHNQLKVLNIAYTKVWTAMLGDPYTKKLYKSLYNDTLRYRETNETHPLHGQLDDTLTDTSNEKELDRTYSPYTYLELWINTLKDSFLKRQVKKMTPEEITVAVNGYFHKLNLDEVLRNESLEFQHLEGLLAEAYDEAKTDEQFFVSYERYKASLQKFLKGNVVNPEFFRENFMRLDIFLQELRYEEIKQQKAYDVIQLLSDIGGSMGLFLGASVLSVIEFVDIFVHQAAKSVCGVDGWKTRKKT